MTKQELMENYTAEEIADMVVAFETQLSETKNGKYSVIFGVSIEKGNITRLKILENGKARIKEVPTVEMFSGNSDENERIYCKGLYPSKELYSKIGVIVKCPDCGKSNKIELDEKSECLIRNKLTDRVHELESEVEKYSKAFEDAKKERDCQIVECRKEIEKLTIENEKLKGNVGSKGYCDKQNKTNNFYGLFANSAKDLTKDDVLIFLGVLTKELIANGIDFRYEMGNEPKVWDIKIKSDKVITDFPPTEPIKVADFLINAEGEYEHNPLVKKICGNDKGAYRIFDISELRQIAEHLLVYCNHNGEVEE